MSTVHSFDIDSDGFREEPSSTNRQSHDKKKSATEKKSVEGFARVLLLTTTGDAAEYCSDCMGLFLLAGEHNNRPYYKQNHTVDTEGAKFLYSSASGKWLVSDTLGGAEWRLKNTARTASVPTSGWKYWENYDPAMTAAPLSDLSSATCSSITILAKGKAARKVPDYLGTFTPTGDYSAGRQVFSSDRGRYLMTEAGCDIWGVTDSVTTPTASIRSGCSPGMCPAHPRARRDDREGQKRWKYWNGKRWFGKWQRWRESDIIVTCATHKYE